MAASAFRPALDLMAQYAAYHRDRRNIATHFVGIPLIVFAVCVLLSRLTVEVGGLSLTPAALLWAVTTVWYLTRGNIALGLAVSALNGLLCVLAEPLAVGSTGSWLAWGVGTFALGWVIQFLGHYYEGKKPAFVDDLIGLAVGPMFVMAELMFALGWGREMLLEIERRVGPTHFRDLTRPLA
ncbi:Mpo1 family 2-hydroxy fatty acid dioxygenase [Roseateles koreensis]|uniref:DUF962 domain-containing protein n=1 Tax=Roseateles koreensis TaxID=2987526 RepID=A0ABT5KLF8_9BURK|nr:Mpo1-like protein [Roseateles koreensis]MDC8783731.1 DUF962 domain-containing protein [Roseateles koreensis]